MSCRVGIVTGTQESTTYSPAKPTTILQNNNDHIKGPEDSRQIDSKPELPPSGGYAIIDTAMDVFPRYFFAHFTAIPMPKQLPES